MEIKGDLPGTAQGYPVNTGNTLDTEAMDTRTMNNSLKVFVNETYVGDKVLSANHHDEIKAISSFLQNKGHKSYHISNEKENINVQISDTNELSALKNNLQEYLDIH